MLLVTGIWILNFPFFTGKAIEHFVVLPHLALAVLQSLTTHLVLLVVFLIAEIVSGKVTNLV